MIGRALTLAGAVAGAAACSQYPAFTQQYVQRLAGQVDALDVVVGDFEASAMRAGLTRTDALAQMTGTAFLADRQDDMRRTFRRHAVLTDDLARLRDATSLGRIALVARVSDPATLRAAWGDFEPAMPLSIAGLATAAIGAAVGWVVAAITWSGLSALLRRGPRRRSRSRARPNRAEPTLARSAARPGPRLDGVRKTRA
ncbi:DUF2937 family protein [Loktanella sp. SALINAS62]|uniref:DUF2937 family protein n=1 Tax=Loktanella sp. SALINAS62 TaxID=2706124 RepID=UPI001B8B9959|nr:DUF2937 family protein [Loktanella sp. SALINAS62]MBS1303132.1 DUF2937 family protein [Loktanella sp. SALINAS62]